MSTVIKPTVGRMAWYWPDSNDSDMAYTPSQPMAAIISYVRSERYVNLMVIDANGHAHARTSVRLVQGNDESLSGERFCSWMPYQIGQAAKNDTEVAELRARIEQLETKLQQSIPAEDLQRMADAG